jgi:uncharacterized protein (TIGR02996 family)
MSDPHGLIEAVHADPEDDLPRLAYADWLEEKGRLPRAAFIRAQVDRARLPADDDRQGELQAAERRLLIEHGLDWLPEIPMESVRYRRGFVEEVAGKASELRQRFAVWQNWPVRRLSLDGDGEDADWLREQPWLGRVVALRFRTAGPAAEAVLESPHLTGLRELAFDGPRPHPHAALIDVLERTTLPERIESLTLGVGLGDLDLERLLALSWPRLRRLHLGECWLTDAGVRQLLYSGLWTRLDDVDLGGATLEAAERPALVRGLECMRATRLTLPRTPQDLDPLAALASARTWGRLADLGVTDYAAPRRPLERFLAHPGVARLTRLDLDLSRGADLTALADCAALSGLRWLETPHHCCGFTALARSQHLSGLRGFRGGGPDEDGHRFLHSAAAAHLRWLSIELSQVKAAALASSPRLGRLATLTGRTGSSRDWVTPQTARSLAEAPGLPSLSWVRLSLSIRPELATAFAEAPRLAWVDSDSAYGRTLLAPLLPSRYRGIDWGRCFDER